MFKNFIFDLDGTLINSSKEVMICFERAFDKANFEIDKSR
ncbi:HAD hydrolase-like protein, partial [bacterium]|nr:HAD hydrolase-like protein [bacterium]